MCGLDSTSVKVEFTNQGQDVTCERCKKFLPEVRRTAWDLISGEEPPQVQPIEVRKPKKPRAKPKVNRTNSQAANSGIAHGLFDYERGVEDPPPEGAKVGCTPTSG